MRPKFEDIILLSSSRAFLLSTPMEDITVIQSRGFFFICLPLLMENSETSWKKATKCKKVLQSKQIKYSGFVKLDIGYLSANVSKTFRLSVTHFFTNFNQRI